MRSIVVVADLVGNGGFSAVVDYLADVSEKYDVIVDLRTAKVLWNVFHSTSFTYRAVSDDRLLQYRSGLLVIFSQDGLLSGEAVNLQTFFYLKMMVLLDTVAVDRLHPLTGQHIVNYEAVARTYCELKGGSIFGWDTWCFHHKCRTAYCVDKYNYCVDFGP